ncbi:inositol monophosphatase [Naegleria gruberi]|uniref:Inositol monophosphatase n=1 Tax=Naegleria gruberi TaxID=5762 RepID=D2VGP0_NAEGR|nr:inositol monophosphatase [Naegleria gruberi]EFC44095.1 inositol monophosphatase [Naegleria gruberi]|eukprot:XP_002676839.1 inositol monophosphatase [Naegleria gruberi strain NEG-M]
MPSSNEEEVVAFTPEEIPSRDIYEKIVKELASGLGSEYDETLEKCLIMAYQAGLLANKFCIDRKNSASLDIEIKKDDSPVTIVDKKVNLFLIGELEKHFLTENSSDIRIIGEEGVSSRNTDATKDLSEGLVFYVDPIDGTRDFIANTGEWAVMIGLCKDGKPVMGCVYCAPQDEMYFAVKGYGAYVIKDKKEKSTISMNQFTPETVKQAKCLISKSNYDKPTENILNELGVDQRVPCGSFGRKVALLASGVGDLYFNFSCKSSYWDSAAPTALLDESGGCLLRKNGQPVFFDGTRTGNDYIMFCCPSSVASLLQPVVAKHVSID